MKKLIGVLLSCGLIINTPLLATSYYFSSSTGDDSRTSAQAQSASTPWKTITKLNSIFSTLKAGDIIYFKRGDTFYGGITISKSGSSGSPISFDAYGSGAKPIITGGVVISAWTKLKTNVWESSSAPSSISTCNMVTVSNINTAMGRWPNSGYSTIGSASGTAITDNSLPSSPSFSGGQAVIRNNHWTLSRNTITTHSGTSLSYTSASNYKPTSGWGYFVENNLNTLDTQNEWYYNPSTKKLDIYSASTPSNVQMATVETLVNLSSNSYISFSNLQLQYANTYAFTGTGSNITISACDINFIGGTAVNSSGTNLTVQNCTILNVNSQGITAGNAGGYTVGSASGFKATNNVIKNIGILPGMADKGSNSYRSRLAICADGDNVSISLNTIDSTGSSGIIFGGNNVTLDKNFLNHISLVTDDGGAIYSWNNPSSSIQPLTKSNRIISNNIIINVIGAPAGTDGVSLAAGIYCDDGVNNVQILNNTIATVPRQGIFLHNSGYITVTGNTVYDCNFGQIAFQQDNLSLQNVSNNNIQKNIFFSKTSSQFCWLYSQHDSWSMYSLGTEDYNYFCRPISESSVFQVSGSAQSLSQWQTSSKLDKNSKKSPKTITDVKNLRFEYNPTTSSKTVTLTGTYMDATGKSYAGSITLAPYTSAILIYSSASSSRIMTDTTQVAQLNPLDKPSIAVFPNPVKDNFALQINNEHLGKMTIQLINQAGALIHSFAYSKEQMYGQINFQANDLPSGVYFIHVQIGEWSDQRKIIKL